MEAVSSRGTINRLGMNIRISMFMVVCYMILNMSITCQNMDGNEHNNVTPPSGFRSKNGVLEEV